MAENLIRNSSFVKKSDVGLPLQWELHGTGVENCLTIENAVKLGGGKADGGAVLVQDGVPLTCGSKYTLSFKVRSKKASRYRVYCAPKTVRDGKTVWLQGSGTAWCTAIPEWQSRNINFTCDKDATATIMAINVAGDGEAEFKDMILEQDKTDLLDKSKLLLNGDFAVRNALNHPLGWEVLGNGDLAYEDGGIVMKGAKTGLILIQHKFLLKTGTEYEVSYEAKSSVIDQEYRVYFETVQTINGKAYRRSYATQWSRTIGAWDNKSFTLTWPENVTSSRLVIQVKPGATVGFRNVTLAEPKQIDEKDCKKQFGGAWHLFGGSRFATDAEGKEMLLVKSIDPLAPSIFKSAGAILKGVPLEAGKTYTLSYAARENVLPGKAAGSPHVPVVPFRIIVAFDGIERKAVSSFLDTLDGDWRDKQFTFTVPADAASGRVDIGCVIPFGVACLTFTGDALAETAKKTQDFYSMTIDNPCYRNTIFASMPVSEITGSIVTDPSIAQVNLTLKNGSTVIYSGKLANSGDSVDFKIPAASLPVGKYSLTAELIDRNGVVVAAPQAVIDKLKPAPMEVVQGKNLTFYINGKPFFPIKLHEMVLSGQDAALYYAARRGVNLVGIHPGQNEAEMLNKLNLFDKYGIKTMVSFDDRNWRPCDEKSLKLWRHRMAGILTPAVVSHPALFGYFTADEPCSGGENLQVLAARYCILKELDPYHPVNINMMPRGSIEELNAYGKAADIFGIDIYPVPYPSNHSYLKDTGLTSVGKYTRRIFEAVGGRKAVLMILQGFSWQQLSIGDKEVNVGFPTAAELRFMTYDALMNGSSSISYWGTYSIRTLSHYDLLFNMTSELHEISGLMTLGEVVDDAVSGSPCVSCRTMMVDGKKYVMAKNNSDKTVTAEITGKFTCPELQVFKENRAVVLNGGKFTDSFKPYDVHVYSEAGLPAPLQPLPPADPALDKAGNPFHEYIKLQLGAVRYDGNANWIWEKENMAVAASKVWLGKEFVMDKPVKSALLLITADDIGTAYFNGQSLGKIDGALSLKKFDLTKQMRRGSNLLSVSAQDAGCLPCGILAELKIETADGEIISILSDATWRATAKETADWLTPAAVRTWSPAEIVAPYGDGAWGRRVQLP